jgi:acyl transferase domain-containing protein
MGSLAGQRMVEESGAMPIAIVGMGCRLPGGASSPERLWDMLLRKESARKETPPDRFNIDAFYHPDADKNGTVSPNLRDETQEKNY